MCPSVKQQSKMKTSTISVLMLSAFLFVFINTVSSATINDLLEKELTHQPRMVVPLIEEERENGKDSMENAMQSGSSKKKGKDNGLQKMYMIFMMCKTLISTLLMFVSPIIAVKSFGLSLIGTLLNIARFIIQLKNSKSAGSNGPNMASASSASYLSALGFQRDPWQEEDRVGIAYNPTFRPSYFSQYPNYIHKYHLKS